MPFYWDDVVLEGCDGPIYSYSPAKDREGNLLHIFAHGKQAFHNIPEGINSDVQLYFPLIKAGSRWSDGGVGDVYDLRGHILVNSPLAQLSFTSVRSVTMNKTGPYQEDIRHRLTVNGRILFSRPFIHEDVNFILKEGDNLVEWTIFEVNLSDIRKMRKYLIEDRLCPNEITDEIFEFLGNQILMERKCNIVFQSPSSTLQTKMVNWEQKLQSFFDWI